MFVSVLLLIGLFYCSHDYECHDYCNIYEFSHFVKSALHKKKMIFLFLDQNIYVVGTQ